MVCRGGEVGVVWLVRTSRAAVCVGGVCVWPVEPKKCHSDNYNCEIYNFAGRNLAEAGNPKIT